MACYGGLDLLVNNAGIGAQGRFAEADPARLRQIMEVNFFAPAEMTRAALPLLKQGRRPMIVNIGSILGHRGIPGTSEYCASKFAVQGFSESLRAELVAGWHRRAGRQSRHDARPSSSTSWSKSAAQAAWSGRRGVAGIGRGTKDRSRNP